MHTGNIEYKMKTRLVFTLFSPKYSFDRPPRIKFGGLAVFISRICFLPQAGILPSSTSCKFTHFRPNILQKREQFFYLPLLNPVLQHTSCVAFSQAKTFSLRICYCFCLLFESDHPNVERRTPFLQRKECEKSVGTSENGEISREG